MARGRVWSPGARRSTWPGRVAGLVLITLLRHADRVKIACIAQLVNAIAPISTATGGAGRQTTYYPFLHASHYGRGTVLNLQVCSPVYPNATFDAVPLLDAIAVLDEGREELAVFAVNRGEEGPLALEGDMRGVASYRVVVPHAGGDAWLDGGRLTATLPRLSWNVIRLAKAAK